MNGRGGDKGVDIRIDSDARLQILQLKYFPEGFSGGFKAVRQKEIKESFVTAQQHQPDEWTLVVPSVLTESEHQFVVGLSGGGELPIISVIDRDELDGWLADDPAYDTFLQRDPTTALAYYAKTFQQETAALMGGADDIAARVAALGRVIDTTDPDWNVDFGRQGTGVSMTVRPAHPNAAERSPIRTAIIVNEFGDGNDEWRAEMAEAFGFGPSDSIRIPSTAVEHIHVEGPAFIAGHHQSADIVLQPSIADSPGVGKAVELRIYLQDETTPMSSWVGTVTNAPHGSLGGTIDADFYGGKLQVRLLVPFADPSIIAARGLDPGVRIRFDTTNALPSVVRDVLAITRQVQTATKIELFLDGSYAATLAATDPTTDYDEDLLIAEQFADDLDVVQRKLGSYFNMPDEVTAVERIDVRIARILLDGGIVASPRSRIYTLVVSGTDSPALREIITQTRQLIHQPLDPHTLKLGDRALNVGSVYVIHPEATPINSEDAAAAIVDGALENFHLTL